MNLARKGANSLQHPHVKHTILFQSSENPRAHSAKPFKNPATDRPALTELPDLRPIGLLPRGEDGAAAAAETAEPANPCENPFTGSRSEHKVTFSFFREDGSRITLGLHRTLGNNVFLFGFFLFPPISARSGFSARSRRGGPAGGLAGRALFALRQNAAEGVWGSEGRFWGGMVPGLSFITVSYYCMIRIITIIIDYLGSGDPRGSGMQ